MLFHLLRGWNKQYEGYGIKTVGIPQDEYGDCSRLLANFYLQEFDSVIKKCCNELDANYLRYSDDMIFFCPDKAVASQLLLFASKELHKIGLDINSSKVKFFDGSDEFLQYWCFDDFIKLQSNDPNEINTVVEKYFNLIDEGKDFRKDSLFKYIVKLDFEVLHPKIKRKILEQLNSKDYLKQCNCAMLTNAYKKVDNKEGFLSLLNELIDECLFNSYHYNLRMFYIKNKIQYNEKELVEKTLSLGINLMIS